jgi:kumamolisin
MCQVRPIFSFRLWLVAGLCVLPFCNIRATVAQTTALTNSIQQVDAAPAAGKKHPHAFISRKTLTAAENSASLDFEIALQMRNFSELQARVNRGELISPAEMAQKYEPLAANYQAAADWLAGEGVTITRRDSRHTVLFARGPISQVAQSLKTTFARVTSDETEYSSAVTAPSVPTTIAPFLLAINGLQPQLRAHKHLLKQQAQPNTVSGSANYQPSQIQQAYSATGLYNMNLSGAGQTIAIVIDRFPSTTDLLQFWKACNVPQSISNIEFIQAVAGTPATPTDDNMAETTLDVEWSSAMAPNAHVRVYASLDLESNDIDTAYQQVLDDVNNHPEYGIHQMSMSFGEGEQDYQGDQGQADTDTQFFASLAARGVTVFASSGDGGASPGDGSSTDETGSLQVEFPASSPDVAGVGGTTLQLDSNNNISSEITWNNSGATGGGFSVLNTLNGTDNTVNFNRPSWQTGTGLPSGNQRAVPDICASADPNFGAIIYENGIESIVGGTSWASPTWAGLCALINQARVNAGQAPLGLLGPKIYPILNSSAYNANFNDITSGNNITPNSGTDYSANVGYDPTTGLGSPTMQTLVTTLVSPASVIGLSAPGAENKVIPGANATFAVTVNGSSATYQWQREPAGSTSFSNLSDGSVYSGSATSTLTVSGATTTMSGDEFQCVVTVGSTTVTTRPSILSVEMPLQVSTLAGLAGSAGYQDGTGSGAFFNIPSGIAIDGSGNLFVADFENNNIRKVTPTGAVSTPYGSTAGGSQGAGSVNGSGNNAFFKTPNSIVMDGSGDFFIADSGNNLIREINPSGTVSTVGSASQFTTPNGVAVDSSGNVYVADTGDNTIRKITFSGSTPTITTIGGRKSHAGYADGNATTAALFNAPAAVAVDSSGNVYVADFGNSVIRKISGGVVSTFAGAAVASTSTGGKIGIGGYLDGPGANALFNRPSGLTFDTSGNLYVADCLAPPTSGAGSGAAGNNLLRKITPAGIVTTLAGDPGNEGTSDGTGNLAQFYSLQAVAFNSQNNTFYLADTYNQTIRAATVANPQTVSISATQPNAQVFGPTPGQFTVTRVGNDANALTVNYSTGGTAISGTDYTVLPGMVTIPAGQTSATITVTPLSNTQATSSPTLQLTLTPNFAYTLGSSTTTTVTITEQTPFQAWETSEFPGQTTDPSVVGELSDPNHNGVPNLLEYAFNANPLQAGTEPLPTPSFVQVNGLSYLALTFIERNDNPNLVYAVQVTSDLKQLTDTWHSGSSYTTVVSQVVNGNITQITVRDNTATSSAPQRFIRVQVTEN